MKVLRKSVYVFLFIILTGCVSSNKIVERDVSCKIIKAGIIGGSKLEEEYESQETTSGYSQIYSSHFVTEKTLNIPLKKDIHFGVEYSFGGLGVDDEIVEKVTHPLIVKPNGESSKGYSRKKKPGKASGYILNRDFELVEGVWKLEYYFKGEFLCGRSFIIKEKKQLLKK